MILKEYIVQHKSSTIVLLVSLLLTSAFAIKSLASGQDNGCCGALLDEWNCALDETWISCSTATQFPESQPTVCTNAGFHVCCFTDGWCGPE